MKKNVFRMTDAEGCQIQNRTSRTQSYPKLSISAILRFVGLFGVKLGVTNEFGGRVQSCYFDVL